MGTYRRFVRKVKKTTKKPRNVDCENMKKGTRTAVYSAEKRVPILFDKCVRIGLTADNTVIGSQMENTKAYLLKCMD